MDFWNLGFEISTKISFLGVLVNIFYLSFFCLGQRCPQSTT